MSGAPTMQPYLAMPFAGGERVLARAEVRDEIDGYIFVSINGDGERWLASDLFETAYFPVGHPPIDDEGQL